MHLTLLTTTLFSLLSLAAAIPAPTLTPVAAPAAAPEARDGLGPKPKPNGPWPPDWKRDGHNTPDGLGPKPKPNGPWPPDWKRDGHDNSTETERCPGCPYGGLD